MICIDGSFGEGGGQILRTSLALSLVTGKPFRIQHIRANRKKPGLRRQHLTAVNAAVEIGQAEVKGNTLNSQSLYFAPTSINPGRYHFAVGTAGSCTLVCQTVLPALLMQVGNSELLLEGGTHNPFAPPFDFLEQAFLPILRRMDANVSATLERPGFFPAGGGRFSVSVNSLGTLRPLDLLERGKLQQCSATALVSQLPTHIATRELHVLREKLAWKSRYLRVEEVRNPFGPGNVLTAIVESEQITEVFSGFGERGVRAEKVASRVVKNIREYLQSQAPVGRYLADQLIIPMALAGGGKFRTLSPDQHTPTNIEVVKQFLGVQITMQQCDEFIWEIQIAS